MGKKTNAQSNLGRALIKSRFGSSKGRRVDGDSMLHTSEVQDGYDWGRLNLQSVTEESSFQEFLSTAELAGTEFQAEKLNIKFVNPKSNVGLLTDDELRNAKTRQDKNRDLLKIPRRPPWNAQTTPKDLHYHERDSFLEWRRSLAQLQEEDGILLTPYEKNLEFWRQLWRVIERSDVVVQIVDARNPLLFRCEDLEKYVTEVSENKMNLILINKADFLTEKQRLSWAEYFERVGVRVAFFSAIQNNEEVKEESVSLDDLKRRVSALNEAVNETAKRLETVQEHIDNAVKDLKLDETVGPSGDTGIKNSAKLLTREELIEFFRNLHTHTKVTSGITTIGLVGYPNVGKSSTINSLLTYKKVSVSATPGKTKHFQTLYLDKDLLLCDCPGLVMPSFVFTKAEMIINGILPIDQMRDHVPPINLVTKLIPRHVLEDTYGLMIPKPMEGEDEDRPPHAEELLNAYGYNRGFMTANGQPDMARSARYILKDFVNGKLLYCHAPPEVLQTEYHVYPERERVQADRVLPPREVRAVKPSRVSTQDLDKAFFQTKSQGIHTKGINLISMQNGDASSSAPEKPWKKINRHANKNKKEKLRRVYAHLDQH